jgi:hypothetical protein
MIPKLNFVNYLSKASARASTLIVHSNPPSSASSVDAAGWQG